MVNYRQFLTADTSPWNYRFGNGSDGDYAPNTGTDAPIDSACTGTINTTSLSATNVSFAAGQLILIHQTQGTGAGQWELNRVDSYTAGTITLTYPLINSYASGAQVLVMPQLSSGNIVNGETITGKAWDGTVGGIYAKFCNGTFTIAGTLNVAGINGSGATAGAGIGFRGAAGLANQANQGEGTVGAGGASTAANGNGGGGGNSSAGAPGFATGGGGGHATSGATGTTFQGGTAGAGGGTAGSANLTNAVFGGSGGGGSERTGGGIPATGGGGGGGGGFTLIIAKSITLTGSVNVNGGNGGAGGGSGAQTGAGAGGSLLLKGQSMVLGTALATAVTGTGVAGGTGRIHADYSATITGTTSPTIDTAQDTIYNDPATGGNYRGYSFLM